MQPVAETTYWKGAIPHAFNAAWEIVIEHSLYSIIALVIIATLVAYTQHKGERRHMKKLGVDFAYTSLITIGVFVVVFCVHLLFVTPSQLYSTKLIELAATNRENADLRFQLSHEQEEKKSLFKTNEDLSQQLENAKNVRTMIGASEPPKLAITQGDARMIASGDREYIASFLNMHVINGKRLDVASIHAAIPSGGAKILFLQGFVSGALTITNTISEDGQSADAAFVPAFPGLATTVQLNVSRPTIVQLSGVNIDGTITLKIETNSVTALK